jgi:hypothetical protein
MQLAESPYVRRTQTFPEDAISVVFSYDLWTCAYNGDFVPKLAGEGRLI